MRGSDGSGRYDRGDYEPSPQGGLEARTVRVALLLARKKGGSGALAGVVGSFQSSAFSPRPSEEPVFVRETEG